jgi:hypothetical protein
MKNIYIVFAESKINANMNEYTFVESLEEFYETCKDTELYNYYLYDDGVVIASIESC